MSLVEFKYDSLIFKRIIISLLYCFLLLFSQKVIFIHNTNVILHIRISNSPLSTWFDYIFICLKWIEIFLFVNIKLLWDSYSFYNIMFIRIRIPFSLCKRKIYCSEYHFCLCKKHVLFHFSFGDRWILLWDLLHILGLTAISIDIRTVLAFDFKIVCISFYQLLN